MRVSMRMNGLSALLTALAVSAGLVVTAPQVAADTVTVTDLTAPLSPFTLSRLDSATATVSFRVESGVGQARAPEVRDDTTAAPFAPVQATRTSGDRTDGTWQATVTLGAFMDGSHTPRVRVCVSRSSCVSHPLNTDIVVQGSDWPEFRRVTQHPSRLAAGDVTGARARGRAVFSDSLDPVPALAVRLIRDNGSSGAVVDHTNAQGGFTSPWPWTGPGQDPARLSLTSSTFAGAPIDVLTLGNPRTRFLVKPPRARAVVSPGQRVTVKGIVTPGYPASRLGGVELQVLTTSGWATRDRAHVKAVTSPSGPRNQAKYRLSTRFEANGKHVMRVVKGPAMCNNDGCRVAGNTSQRFSVFVGNPTYLVESRLHDLNVPVGTVDGVVDDRSRQAFCAWRDMAGQPVSRRGVTPKLLRSVMQAKDLPAPKRTNGIYVNKTCQVLLQVKRHEFKRVVWVSTGMPGHETPSGTGAIFRKVKGWVESTLYPGAFMLDPMFFFPNRPGIALHGSVSNSLVLPHPASHGCVRTWRPQIRKIFNESPIGTKVKVYGHY